MVGARQWQLQEQILPCKKIVYVFQMPQVICRAEGGPHSTVDGDVPKPPPLSVWEHGVCGTRHTCETVLLV